MSVKKLRRILRIRDRVAYTASVTGVFIVLFFFIGPFAFATWLAAMLLLMFFALVRSQIVARALIRAAAEGRVQWLHPRRWKRRGVIGTDDTGRTLRASAAPYSLAMADRNSRVAVLRRGGSAWVLGAELLKEWYGLSYPEVRHLFPKAVQRFAVARLLGQEAMVALVADNTEDTKLRLSAVQFLKATPAEWKRWYKPSKARSELELYLDRIDDPRVLEAVLRWTQWDPRASVEPLVRALTFADAALSQIATWFLTRSKRADAESAVLTLLEDERPEVLAPAVEVLAAVGKDASFDALIDLQRRTTEPAVQRAIGQALGNLRRRTENSTYDGRLALVADHDLEGQLSIMETEGGLQFAEEVELAEVEQDQRRGELVYEEEAETVVEVD